MTIEVLSAPDYAELSQVTAGLIAAVVAARPAATLLLATGETPTGAYAALAEHFRRGQFDPSQLRVFQLDEYVGVAEDDRRSLYGWMRRVFLAPLAIAPERVVRLPGDAPDLQLACQAYDRAVHEHGGIDLAVLGLGPNGHLGFNEPPSDRHAPTRVVELTAASVESNARYWGGRDQVPRRAITAGMHVLLAARQIVLVVAGAHKREVLYRALRGPVTPDLPASFLQTAAAVTVVADRAAWP